MREIHYLDMIRMYRMPPLQREKLYASLRAVLHDVPVELVARIQQGSEFEREVARLDAEWRRLRSRPNGWAEVMEADRVVDRKAAGLVQVLRGQLQVRNPDDPLYAAIEGLLARLVPGGFRTWCRAPFTEQTQENNRVADLLREPDTRALLEQLGLASAVDALLADVASFEHLHLADRDSRDWKSVKAADNDGVEHLARLIAGIVWVGHNTSWQASALDVVDRHMEEYRVSLRRSAAAEAKESEVR